ncbi:protein phosphatase 1 regulatory subunit 3B [Scophthalmus maximus]|nr:protein phosphatase 1 regulatory subunit 3B [Scophthalmus maximus]KAF0031826.1 hypothetical protein F2P81_016381 [Scophthalmus maximus]
MPSDMALPLYLPKEEFVFRTTPSTREPAPRRRHSHCDDRAELQDDAGRSKKQVTFADHRGLSLTRVKVFSQFNDPINIPASVREALSSARCPAAEEDKLVLDFAQPSSDYLLFRQRLETDGVSLERCVLKDEAVTGTVKVKNMSFEKRVKLRVTFDTWSSHTDVDCSYVKDAYPSSYSDTFCFLVSLPELQRHQRVEFAICYEVGGRQYWDSNRGDNYKIVWSSMKRSRTDAGSRRTDSVASGIHFDPYGSPTCSHRILPDWPSYAGYENIGPYY